MNLDLTKEIAYEAVQNFFNNKPFVLFGTGPSIAMDKHFVWKNLKIFFVKKFPGKPSQVKKISSGAEWLNLYTGIITWKAL